jgi:hypothetical protein
LNPKSDEMILAQEQSVVSKTSGRGQKADLEGTLVLTNKRVIFVSADQSTEGSAEISHDESMGDKLAQETSNLGMSILGGKLRVSYSDVDDLGNIPNDPNNLLVPISTIISISGHKGVIGMPNLKLSWRSSGGQIENGEFQQILTEGRRKNLSDWAPVIERLKDGSLSPRYPDQLPQNDSVEDRIYYVMGDMQTKGDLQIEQETEKHFGVELEPDEVQGACDKLVSIGLLDKIPDASGDNFYKKRSPLGEDDLSS